MNQKAAEEFVQGFSDYVKTNGFIPQQVFHSDETGLFWKKMPRRTYITEEEKEELDFITVKFVPPNTTPLIQPMDQQVISNFKKLYTKALFQRCFEVTSDTELTLRDFWKHHFNILHCLTLIDEAWQQVTYRTMNSAWRKL